MFNSLAKLESLWRQNVESIFAVFLLFFAINLYNFIMNIIALCGHVLSGKYKSSSAQSAAPLLICKRYDD